MRVTQRIGRQSHLTVPHPTDVLRKIIDGRLASKRDELMPWAYAPPTALRDVA